MWDLGSHLQIASIPREHFKTWDWPVFITTSQLKSMYESISIKSYNSLYKSPAFPLSMSLKNIFFPCIPNVSVMTPAAHVHCSLYLPYHLRTQRGERNNTEGVSLLLNLTDFIICSSSKNHLCWQFAVCLSSAALYISLFARSDSDSTNSPVWQTCGCRQQIGVLYL